MVAPAGRGALRQVPTTVAIPTGSPACHQAVSSSSTSRIAAPGPGGFDHGPTMPRRCRCPPLALSLEAVHEAVRVQPWVDPAGAVAGEVRHRKQRRDLALARIRG